MSYALCRECWKVGLVYGRLKLCVQCDLNRRENQFAYIYNKLTEEHWRKLKETNNDN